MFRLYRALLVGSALVPLCAHAQAVSTAGETNATTAVQDSGDIVVTAQRRSERLTDVPISITAITGENLTRSGITNLTQLGQGTPGLNVANSGVATQPIIRGVGSSGTALGESANVATYVDGVYIANQVGLQYEFADIERVEVLKGPQGTLFGRNATGGAIQLITRQPEAGFSGFLRAGYGNFADRDVNAYITGGSDRLSASLTGLYRANDGYAFDVNLHRKTAMLERYAGRAKIRFVPSDMLEFTLSGDYSYNRQNDFYAFTPVAGNAAGYTLFPALPRGNGPRQTALSFDPYDTTRQGGVSLKAVLDAGAVEISSVTAARWYKDHLKSDSDATAAALLTTEQVNPGRTISQEFDFTSKNSGKFNWIAGIFYFNSLARLDPLLINGALFNQSRLDTNAYAAFGEATYAFTDRLTLVGGLRYSVETQEIDTRNGAGARQAEDATFKSATPRITLRYKPSEQTNLYMTFSQGFKSGTFNATSIGARPVRPERIDAYEIGFKSSQRSLSFSGAVYYYKYKDLQVQALLTSTTALATLQNAARATIYGADADMTWRVTPHFTLTLGAAYNHAQYDAYLALAFLPKPGGGGNVGVPTDVSGRRLPRMPEYSFNVAPRYTTHLMGGELALSGSVFVSGKYFWDSNNRLNQPSYTLVNGLASWSPAGSPFRFSIYGNNLTNRTLSYYTTASALADRTAYQSPRTYGGRVEISF